MNIIKVEEYLREKYGILSIIEEKKQDILDELEKKGGKIRKNVVGNKNGMIKDEWKKDLDKFVLDCDLREYFIGESIKFRDGKIVTDLNNLLVMVVKSYDCIRPKRSSIGDFDNDDLDNDLKDEIWDDLMEYDNNHSDNFGNKKQEKVELDEEKGKKGKGFSSKIKLKKRMLYFTLTTGKMKLPSSEQSSTQKNDIVIINALEYERLNCMNNEDNMVLYPGTKLLLNLQQGGLSKIQVQNSILLLNNNNVKYLGGNVESLVESWKLNNILSGSGSKGFSGSKNLTKKPPKFIPFANKESERKQLNEQVKDAQQSYQQNKEIQSKLKSVPCLALSSTGNTNKVESENDSKNLENSVKAYNEFIEEIQKYKKQNLISLEKFNLSSKKATTTSKISASSENDKNKLHDDRDPGAPLRGRLLRSTEKIDSDAREFLKSRHDNSSNITLFDHLFSKLEIKDALSTGKNSGVGVVTQEGEGRRAAEGMERGEHSSRGGGHSGGRGVNSGRGGNSGRGHSSRGGGHSNRGGGHSSRGGGHSNRGGGHSNRGGGHSNRGGGHSNRGGGHSNRGGRHSSRGGHSTRGGGKKGREGNDKSKHENSSKH
ncbi:RecQ mediated genome instability protein N-terminal domain containing protein [Cryptosporidium tyzzeri]|nr:RecQ mediated genome instability protein N-terminal domain containing protein [Cryptosporidium tyzzeri]